LGKLIQVEVGRFDYDFVGEFKFFKADGDGKVRRPSVLVRLTDDEGYQGWGQAVPTPTWTYETPETVESTIAHYLAEVLLGRRAKITSHFETAELIGVWFDSVVPGRQEIVWMKI